MSMTDDELATKALESINHLNSLRKSLDAIVEDHKETTGLDESMVYALGGHINIHLSGIMEAFGHLRDAITKDKRDIKS